MAHPVAESALRKVRRRLIPFLFLLYVVAYLDRVNVGFAAIDMYRDLGFSAAVYGFGAGVFFVGYVLCEVPSNLILVRVGARLWIARIMITWGIISVAMMFVRGPLSFYALRFLLRESLSKAMARVRNSPVLMFCATFVVTLGIAVGLATTNLGTLSRYRMPLVPFFATLLLLVTARSLEPMITRVRPPPA